MIIQGVYVVLQQKWVPVTEFINNNIIYNINYIIYIIVVLNIIITYYIIIYYIILYYVTLRYVKLRYVTLRYIILYYIILYYIILYYINNLSLTVATSSHVWLATLKWWKRRQEVAAYNCRINWCSYSIRFPHKIWRCYRYILYHLVGVTWQEWLIVAEKHSQCSYYCILLCTHWNFRKRYESFVHAEVESHEYSSANLMCGWPCIVIQCG